MERLFAEHGVVRGQRARYASAMGGGGHSWLGQASAYPQAFASSQYKSALQSGRIFQAARARRERAWAETQRKPDDKKHNHFLNMFSRVYVGSRKQPYSERLRVSIVFVLGGFRSSED